MKNRDYADILLAVGVLFLFASCMVGDYKNTQQSKQINEMQQQIEIMQEENEFLKEHYEEEIVMLDSQLLLLESEVVELKDGAELIKK